MIDVSNLKDTLKTLGFIAYGDIYEKVFSEIGCSLKVDFQAKRLIYPNEIKGRERNNGFDKKENFVVFECVCRLLLKEYQFLGDLFEQLLNKGFKQNEGQFFTPIPITRFIWDSLPVDRMVKSDRGNVYPKVIDYACGAGHFLTEAIEAASTT